MTGVIPVLVLGAVAVVVPEIVFGATPLTEPGRILATLPIYAGGAILIRELARRRGAGWPQIAMLGVAYGIVEEGLALGSLFNPALFNAGEVGARAFGVNWTWTQWTLGYHAVWSILIPILLTELVFPDRRSEPWLGKIGLVIAGAVYVLGAVFLGLIFRLVVAPDFEPPPLHLSVAAILVAGLFVVALAPRGVPGRSTLTVHGETVPSPWLVGLASASAAFGWFGLLVLPGPVKSTAWVMVPMIAAAALLVAVASRVWEWSAPGNRWTDLHRLALAAGPLPASVTYGLTRVTVGNPGAWLGEAIAAVAFGALLGVLARRTAQRTRPVPPSRPRVREGPFAPRGA